jgi:hypothetical protein
MGDLFRQLVFNKDRIFYVTDLSQMQGKQMEILST